jgi:hypothetical protein
MGDVVQLRDEPGYFGGCPKCGCDDGYLNVGSCHWMVCEEHKMTWCVGANLFSSWRKQSEKVWEENARRLSEYMEVEPLLPVASRPTSQIESLSDPLDTDDDEWPW